MIESLQVVAFLWINCDGISDKYVKLNKAILLPLMGLSGLVSPCLNFCYGSLDGLSVP